MGYMHFDFMSDRLGYQTNIYVIIPECVNKGKEPSGILYLLHGGAGNGLDWVRNTSIERYAYEHEVAVIMPETDGSCFYADMKYGYPYYSYLTEEVPIALEAMLPVLKKVKKRYVAGLSMGGYGAFKWAFNSPGYFTAAANLSGISFITDLFSDKNNAHEGLSELIENCWGSLDELAGSISDSRYWIDRAASEKTALPKLFAGIGTEDFSYSFAVDYINYCKEKGIEVHYEEMPGGHEWSVWDVMIEDFLSWADKL